ncbi:MAG: hypothetical protein M1292_11530 [Bacteroidetes bacterium]|nr:hypothetical protein [Bacteroidota bacterium]
MTKAEEKTHAEILEEIVGRKLRPFYWIMTGFVTVYAAVSTPLTIELIRVSTQQSKDITKEEAEKTFIQKEDYHILQKAEHISDVEAIQNPHNALNVYMRHNNDESERLKLNQR